MMVKPGISTLLKRVDSRYTLVTMAAKRARMIGSVQSEKNEPITDASQKPVSMAVDEISQGRVGYIRSDSVRRAKEWENEKAAAIIAMNDNQAEIFADINREVNDVISEPVFGESIVSSTPFFDDEE